jgi:hypothetical protein
MKEDRQCDTMGARAALLLIHPSFFILHPFAYVG